MVPQTNLLHTLSVRERSAYKKMVERAGLLGELRRDGISYTCVFSDQRVADIQAEAMRILRVGLPERVALEKELVKHNSINKREKRLAALQRYLANLRIVDYYFLRIIHALRVDSGLLSEVVLRDEFSEILFPNIEEALAEIIDELQGGTVDWSSRDAVLLRFTEMKEQLSQSFSSLLRNSG